MKSSSKLPSNIPSNEEYRAQAIESFHTAQTLSEENENTAGAYYWDCISCLSQVHPLAPEDQWYINQSYFRLGHESRKTNQAHFARFYFKKVGFQEEDDSRLVTANTQVATSTNRGISAFSLPPKKRHREESLIADKALEEPATNAIKHNNSSSPGLKR